MKNLPRAFSSFVLTVLGSTLALGQQHVVFSEAFEVPATGWTKIAVAGENNWAEGECAGNGSSFPGSQSLYVTDESSSACGFNYSYANALSGTSEVIAYRSVDLFCGVNPEFRFDYRVGGDLNDYAEVVYSTDGGLTWIVPVGGLLVASPVSWTTQTLSLPAALENTTFLLGFRFVYNDNTVNNPSLAVDNLLLTVTDNIPPALGCPVNDTIFTNLTTCSQEIPDLSKRLITLSDNCTDSVDVQFNQFPGPVVLTGHLSNALITLEATDLAGNTSSCQINVVLVDLIVPQVTCPSDFSVDLNANCEYVVEDFQTLVAASDNCSDFADLVYSQSPPIGAVLSGGPHTITLNMEDEAGNIGFCQFQLTLVDNLSPIVTCPSTQTVYADGSCNGIVDNYLSLASISDNCTASGNLVINQSPLPGSTMSANQIIQITAVDENFNSANCTFTANLVDTIRPNIVCPGTQTIFVNAQCEAALPDYTPLTLVSDNCAGPLPEVQTPLAGTVLAPGSQLVSIEVSDAAGNTRSCSFTVNVIDNTAPLVTCPGNQQIYADANCVGLHDDYTALVVASDNCTPVGSLIVGQSPVAGAAHSGLAVPQTVQITVEDAAGNQGVCSFDVVLLDTISPTIVCSGNQTVSANASCEYVLADFRANGVAQDNCTAQGLIVKSQSPVIGTNLPIGVHTITITAQDASGNTANCSFQLTVQDNTIPNIVSCAPNTSVNADPDFCSASLGNYTSLVVANDNCTSSFDLTVTQSPIPGTVISANQTVQITVTDISGNSSICSFNVALIDVTPPAVQCTTAVQATIVSNCDYLIPNVMQHATATDNCSPSNLVFSQVPAVGSLAGGATNVTVTVTDAGGNTASCVTQVTPLDLVPPTIVCPSNQVVNNGTACDGIIGNYAGAVSVTDNCFGWTITQSPVAGSVIPSGTTEVTMTVVDIGGNESTCTFELLLFENVVPEITCPDEIETCNPQVVYSAPAGTDNCVAVVTQTDASGLTSGDSFPIGTTVQTYTVTDPSGNSAQCSFNVTVLEYPDAAVVEADFSLCAVTSAVISANESQTGSGLWTVITGGGQLNNQFAATTGVNNLSIGLNELVWTISTAACGETSDTLRITVYQLPLPASVVDTVYACDLQFVQVSGNQPSAGSGLWTDPSGNATFSDPNSVPTSVFNLQEGWNDIVWTITNGSCPPSSDTVRIYKSEQARILTPDEQPVVLCLDNNVLEVAGNVGAPGVESFWSFVVGEGIFSDPFSPETSISNIRYGENTLVYRLKKQQCPPTYDTLQIVVNVCGEYGVFPNMITPNGDGQNDVWVLNNIGAMHPDVVVRVFNRWGNLVFESEGYTQNWNGTHNGEPLPMGTYYYVIELNDAASTVYKGHVSIIY